MTDEPKTADIIPYGVLRQMQLNRYALKHDKHQLPKEVPVLDAGWDEPDVADIPVMDRGVYWGPEYADPKKTLLTRYFAERQRDHGDETDAD